MRDGRTTPNGGLYISMGHLGRDKVAKMFKGMVERCADCGFDLAGVFALENAAIALDTLKRKHNIDVSDIH